MRLHLAFVFVVVAGCTSHNPKSGQDMSVHGVSDMNGAAVDLSAGDLAASDGQANVDGPSCGAQGDKCTNAGGAPALCNAASGVCACGGASADSDCDSAYGGNGTTFVCAAGVCVAGNCSSSAACTMGQQCVANNCTACSGSGGADTCKSDPVYGNPYECVNGACLVGNCRSDADCTQGGTSTNTQLCFNFNCTPCTSDQQCQADTDPSGTAGASSLCNTGNNGVCVKNVTCLPASTGIASEEAACAQYNNGSDICCGGACVSGSPDGAHDLNCCSAGDCTGSPFGSVCQPNGSAAGICSACTPVAAVSGTTTYWVDPAAGDDQRGTGNNVQQGCGFATIRRALQVIGGSPTGNVVIMIATGTQTLLNTPNPPRNIGELYPIVVPANVTITTEHNGGAGDVTVTVPPTQVILGQTVPTPSGFVFSGKNSGLANLTISGGNMVATGVQILGYAPTAGQPVTLSDVSISGFTGQGVLVSAPSSLPANPQLAVTGGNHGTHVDNNGSDTLFANGMTVLGSASVMATDKSKPITFSGNGQHGIAVQRSGQLALTGGSGTTAPSENTAVVLANNRMTGLLVSQTPTGNGAMPLNLIKGVTITGSGTGPTGVTFTNMNAHGLRVGGGSSLSLRTSLIYGNAKGSGVRVEDFHGANTTVSDVSNISLGSSGSPGADAGNNLLQGNGSSLPVNAGAGVCLAIAPNIGQTLKAMGNKFAAVDCTMVTTKLTSGNSCSSGAVDVAVTGRQMNMPNTINVSMCQ